MSEENFGLPRPLAVLARVHEHTANDDPPWLFAPGEDVSWTCWGYLCVSEAAARNRWAVERAAPRDSSITRFGPSEPSRTHVRPLSAKRRYWRPSDDGSLAPTSILDASVGDTLIMEVRPDGVDDPGDYLLRVVVASKPCVVEGRACVEVLPWSAREGA